MHFKTQLCQDRPEQSHLRRVSALRASWLMPLLLACIWSTPAAAQIVTLLDVTQTGADLTSNPDVVFYETPIIQGSSIDLTNVGETILFEWTLLPAALRLDIQVAITVDYTRVTADSDPTIGIHDGSNLVGLTRSDNSSGAFLTREGVVDGLTLPAFTSGTLLTGIDPLETFQLTYDVPAVGSDTGGLFAEGADSQAVTFSSNPVDPSSPLTLFWGGSTIDEVHRIDQIRVVVTGRPQVVSPETDGLTYQPIANCGIVNTTQAALGKMNAGETRLFLVRGEDTDYSSQGGSATGCGVPLNAEAVAVNFTVFSHDGNGRLRAGASDQSLGAGVGTLIRYDEIEVSTYTNASIIDLCSSQNCNGDFQLRTQGSGSRTHVQVDVVGYFAPFAIDTVATTSTEVFTIAGDGGLEIGGGDLAQVPGTPVRVGSASYALSSVDLVVNGTFAYAIGQDDSLVIFDITDPGQPVVMTSIDLESTPRDIAFAGSTAYVLLADKLQPIYLGLRGDHGLLTAIAITGGENVAVSGHFAFVAASETLHVISIADPSHPEVVLTEPIFGSPGAPARVAVSGQQIAAASGSIVSYFGFAPTPVALLPLPIVFETLDLLEDLAFSDDVYFAVADTGTLYIGHHPNGSGFLAAPFDPSFTDPVRDVDVAGRYLYMATQTGLAFVDIADPAQPQLGLTSPTLGSAHSVAIDGHHAYVGTSAGLEVFELTHSEFPALTAHSAEVGQLGVTGELIAQDNVDVLGGVNVGEMGVLSSGPVSAKYYEFDSQFSHLTPPSGVARLFAQDVDGAATEVRVQDSDGNITTLSPHNFSLVGEPSEPLAWSFYSQNDHGAINIDMLRALRVLEQLSGEKLVHIQRTDVRNVGAEEPALAGTRDVAPSGLRQRLHDLERQNRELTVRVEKLLEAVDQN